MQEIIMLIGRGTTSYGCGVLVSYKQRKYIATAGHVIRLMGQGPFWAIHGPELKKTQNPAGGYRIMGLVNEIVDNHWKSDLAICELTRDIDGNAVQLDELLPADDLIGTKVIATGYPVDYVLDNVKLESEQHLPPMEARGEIIGLFDSKITVESEEVPVSGYYVRMDQALQNHGSGFSGALITDESKTPLGIIVAGFESGDLIFTPIAQVRSLVNRN